MIPLEDLAKEALRGDAASLSSLCERLQSPVFRLCLRMLGSRSDAEEAAQDILVKVLTHLSQFEERSALMTWVHRISVRHLLAQKRSSAEERAVPIEDFGERIERGLAFGAQAGPASPEDQVLEKEVRLSCTQGMLLALGREERLAVVLVDVLGLDAAEAAEVAEVSHAALRKRLSRARSQLQAFLKKTCGVANPDAPCRCVRQIPAKVALGLSVPRAELSALTQGEVFSAANELRTVSATLRADGPLFAPATLRRRLAELLPTLLR